MKAAKSYLAWHGAESGWRRENNGENNQ